jgi:LmbE family N-acetylglucosaminyl deacetylase
MPGTPPGCRCRDGGGKNTLAMGRTWRQKSMCGLRLDPDGAGIRSAKRERGSRGTSRRMASFIENSALVMAHPDDEVLWASSIVGAVDDAVLCFGAAPGNRLLGPGREAALAAHPVPGIAGLGITEQGSLNSAAWPCPRETGYGVEVHGILRSSRTHSSAGYRANFDRLVEALRPRLRGRAHVVTHNPWGEYGHEHHIQVFRAVAALGVEIGFTVWVSCYFSDRSAAMMMRSLPFLGPPCAPRPTDTGLAHAAMKVYQDTRTWTWFDDYAWPETEVFYPWRGQTGAPPRAMHLNCISTPPLLPDRSSLKDLARKAARAYLARRSRRSPPAGQG